MNDDRHEYLTLDGMRGIAAFAVMVYHIGQHCRPIDGAALFRSGFLAVDLFFLLSGFVLSHSYDARIGKGLSARRFMLARYIRLGPLVTLGVVLGLIQALVAPDAGKDLPTSPGVRLAGVPFDILMLPSFFGGSPRMFPLNPPEWSLFYEIFANLLLVATFRFLRRERLLTLLVLGDMGLLLIAMIHFHGATFGNTLGSMPYGILRVVFSFFLGVGIRRALRLWWTRLPTVPPAALYGLLAILLSMPTPTTAYQIFVVMIANPLMIMFGAKAVSGRQGGNLGRWLGRISYPVYIVHMPVMFLLAGLMAFAGFPAAAAGAATVIVVVALGSILPSWFDEPLRSKLAMLASRRFPVSPTR